VKEKRGNLRQRAICEGGEGKFEIAGHLRRREVEFGDMEERTYLPCISVLQEKQHC